MRTRRCFGILGVLGCLGAAADAGAADTNWVRYTTAGVPDLTVPFGTGNTNGLLTVTTMSTGKVYVGGYTTTAEGELMPYVKRYKTDGTPDTTFGVGGTATWDEFPGSNESVVDIALDGSNRVLVSVQIEGGALVTRLTAAGAVDTTFGTGGWIFPFGMVTGFRAGPIAKGPSNKVVVLSNVEFPPSFRVARLTSVGALDGTFAGGVVSPTFVSGETTGEVAKGMAVETSGKVTVVGSTPTGTGTMGALRLTNAGAMDTTFATGGRLTIDFSSTTHEEATSVAVEAATGSIYVVGRRDPNTMAAPRILLTKLSSTGVLDTAFGKLQTTIPGGISSFPLEWSLALTNESPAKIVVGGTVPTTAQDKFVVVRYLSTNALDTTFDTDGRAITAFPGFDARAMELAVDPSTNKPILGGFTFPL